MPEFSSVDEDVFKLPEEPLIGTVLVSVNENENLMVVRGDYGWIRLDIANPMNMKWIQVFALGNEWHLFQP